MPRGLSVVVAATALSFVGLALAITGALLLPSHKGLGLALLGGGLVVVIVGTLVAAPRLPPGGNDRPPPSA